MRMRKLAFFAIAAGVAVAGCSTLERFGVVNRNAAGQIGSTASDQERISLVPAEDQLLISSALQGVTFSLPPAAPIADWPLAGGNLEQSVEHVASAPTFRVAWSRDIGRGSNRARFITAPPVAAGGLVYTMDAGAMVTAHDASSGREVWAVDLSPGRDSWVQLPNVNLPFFKGERQFEDTKGFGGGLAVADGKLYVTSGFRFVAALDARTGAQAWRTSVTNPIHAAPTVSGGRVFAVSADNELETFDAATGAKGWAYQALAEPVRILKASSPAVSGDTIIAGFASGEIIAARTTNGNELWSGSLIRVTRTTALSEIRDIVGRPVVYRGDVYAGSHSGAFAAIDLRTGQPRWQIPLVTMASPLPTGDVVYAVSKYGQVICIARQSGLIYWITNLNAQQDTSPERWYEFWRGGKPDTVYWSGPILASGRLITVSTSGNAVALDPATGQVQSSLNLGGPALMEPIAAGGYLYVVTDNGKLVAIG